MKPLAMGVILALVWAFVDVIRTAKRASQGELQMQKHVSATNRLFSLIVLLIIIIRVMVIMGMFGPGNIWHDAWFIIHLLFAVSLLAILVKLRFRTTGERSPRTHRRWAYFSLVPFSGTVTTGLYLLLR